MTIRPQGCRMVKILTTTANAAWQTSTATPSAASNPASCGRSGDPPLTANDLAARSSQAGVQPGAAGQHIHYGVIKLL
jgi:hypothetical protein